MARHVDFEFTPRTRHEPEKYLDGQTWEIDIEKDIGNVSGFRSAFFKAAVAKGLTPRTAKKGGKLYVQAVKE